MNQSTQEAYELSRRAVESAPQNATFLDTEGVALLALGRYEEAEEVFEEALRLSPSEPGLLLGVAEALHGQGDTPGAEAALSRMEQAMRTSGPLAPEVRDRLARLREALSEGSLSSAGG
jgi:Flp pilus assembly protein TadD